MEQNVANKKDIITDLLSKSKPVESMPGYYWSKEKKMLFKPGKGPQEPTLLKNIDLNKKKISKVIMRKGLK